MFNLRDFDVQQKLNSLTKYPPIPTFHEMDPKNGMLDGSKTVDFGGQLVSVTEKIDGTNGRVVIIPPRFSSDQFPHWVIGSRENLLTCDEDWFANPELGIVEELLGAAESVLFAPSSNVRVYFFEVYGGRIGESWRDYSTRGDIFGHRLFDVIEFDDDMFVEMMSRPREHIASWRQRGGQPFVGWDRMLEITQEANLDRVPTIEHQIEPRGIAFDGLRNTLETLTAWFPSGTEAALEDGARMSPEGVVFKSHDRKITAKLRFQDYKSTIKRLEIAAKKEADRKLRDVE